MFALLQAVGALTFLRPYVADFSANWLIAETAVLVAGTMSLVFVSLAIFIASCAMLHFARDMCQRFTTLPGPASAYHGSCQGMCGTVVFNQHS